MMKNGNEDRPLPDGWQKVTLQDIATIERGITFPASAKQKEPFEGGIACLRTTNVQENVEWDDLLYVPETYVKKDEKLLQQGDILISMANSYELVGKVSFVEQVRLRSSFGGFIAAIRSHNGILPKYLFYYLRVRETQSFIRRNSSQTVNIANLSLQRLYPTPIHVAPLAEQKHIVAEIEKQFTRLDQAVAALRRLQSHLARYKASVLKAACEGRLVPQDPSDEPAGHLLSRVLAERRAQWQAANPGKKYREPQGVDTAGLPELPQGWVWAGLEQLSTHIVDCLHSTPKFSKSGEYCIDTTCIEPARILFDKARYVSEAVYRERVRRLEPQAGDILFAREGTIGTAVLVPENVKLCLGQRMMMFRPVNVIMPRYFMWAMLSPVFEEQWQPKVIGTTAPHVNIRDLRVMGIPLPPLAEQKRIVAEIERRLSVIAAGERAIQTSLARAERLRQSILHRAFTGRLVPPQPEAIPSPSP